MKVNKVVFNGETLIDITDTNFNERQLPEGSVVYNAAGERIVGRAIVNDVYTDTTENWNKKTGYVPKDGDIIVYSDRYVINEDGNETNVPGIKIGDGNAYVVDLPFIDSGVYSRLEEHMNDTDSHITAEERVFWNNKLNFNLIGENLIFNRN